jgi:hypothetical protein
MNVVLPSSFNMWFLIHIILTLSLCFTHNFALFFPLFLFSKLCLFWICYWSLHWPLGTFIYRNCADLNFFGRNSPQCARASSFTRFLDHTQRRTTVGRTLLDEWSARRTDLYLTTHNYQNRQTAMAPMGFELTISAGERPQTYALEYAASGIGETSSL